MIGFASQCFCFPSNNDKMDTSLRARSLFRRPHCFFAMRAPVFLQTWYVLSMTLYVYIMPTFTPRLPGRFSRDRLYASQERWDDASRDLSTGLRGDPNDVRRLSLASPWCIYCIID